MDANPGSRRIEELEAENARLRAENESLKAEVQSLRQLVKQLQERIEESKNWNGSRRGRRRPSDARTRTFGGVLVSDCLASYENLHFTMHKCYAHHLKPSPKRGTASRRINGLFSTS